MKQLRETSGGKISIQEPIGKSLRLVLLLLMMLLLCDFF